ncbi:MAG TPA: FKBP-type peptidyl-prolyl cis-trans isomerase [Jatrophihabitans sp.]|nr:FKBP-type peptidyl-prolyl cis-trans isomerase [Jatrophihabitans sp.]
MTVPDKAAPDTLRSQVLVQGQGAAVAKGDTLVANYTGQTWAAKSGKPNIFDSSFQRGHPAAFQIGVGSVIPGWDKTLVGQKIGSRVLLAVPPADGYGTNGQASANISGTDTLVFVVDVVASYPPNSSSPGTAVAKLPTTDFPKITNPPGQQPKVLSTAGVHAPKKPIATLVATGHGAKIDPARSLVLQIVQTDIATGKSNASSWGKAPQVVTASSVLRIAPALSGQRVGSRVVVLAPATPATPASASQQAQSPTPAEVLIVDVVGQF